MNFPKPAPPKTPLHATPVQIPELSANIRKMTEAMLDDKNTVEVVTPYDVNRSRRG